MKNSKRNRPKRLRNRNGRHRRHTKHFELLESQRLLAGNNTFAQFVGEVPIPAFAAEIPITLSAADFTLPSGRANLGFHVTSDDGSLLDPGQIEIVDAVDGGLVSLSASNANVLGDQSSAAVAELGIGEYTIRIHGEGATVGGFSLDVYLAGDVDGDRIVDTSDVNFLLTNFGAILGQAAYRLEADANLDGRITSFDLFQAQSTRGASTQINPLDLTAVATIEGVETALITDADALRVEGTTLADLEVHLDIDNDGQAEFTTTADPAGDFSFDLAFADPGLRQLDVSTSDAFGQTRATTLALDVVESFAISSVTPSNGAEMVSPARELVVRFTEEVNPATIDSNSIHVIANGQTISGRLVVSSTNRFVTFFPDNPWPASTEIRFEIDGSLILAADGDPLDANGDGLSGGIRTVDFRTLPLTRIAGTNVFGFVRDSFSELPIVGATIRVDAFPEANVTTDENGRFELVDMPAPVFFVHIDGSTATNAPAGFAYPDVGKPFHSVPGQTVQLEMDGDIFDVFLPPVADEDFVDLSPNNDTEVHFGDAAMGLLAQEFPNVAAEVWERMEVMFPANSAVDDFGNPATEAVIVPVPSDRIPAPLSPEMVSVPFVVSIQAPGATRFDNPAPVTFPNFSGLGPGEQSLIWSFDHDAGEWITVGTGTVSADGLVIVSDPA